MRLATPLTRPFAVAALALLAACADRSVMAPVDSQEPTPLAALQCTADVRAQSLRCAPAGSVPGGVSGNLILGGQGSYVRLASSGITYDGVSLFTVDVTVQNLLGQPIGTTDGTTVDPEGIKVFFFTGPSSPDGTVEVANEDGSGMFLGSEQPFFSYVERLTTEQTSAPHEWRFTVPPSVASFTFQVYVDAPVPDETALNVIDMDPRTLAVGGFHSCALTDAGQAYCWGINDDSQLGRAGGLDSVPVPVSGGHFWRTLTAGRYHTCGVTTDNQAYCWGDNQTGQLGTGVEDDASVPTPVAGGRSWMQLDAGAGHTCGVTTTYEAFCWGDGAAGQLGAADSASAGTPVAVFGGRKFVAVDAGTDHSCGVTRGGAAYCWGDNSGGELGKGTGPSTARPALVAGNHSWRAVSAGESYSCGVTSLGAAMCWGVNTYGQIGNGAAPGPGPATPQAVSGGLEWARVTAGRETSCGITTGAAAYCWGFNTTREIADGTTDHRNVPTAVTGGQLYTSIDGGDYHTCGVNQDGVARCWGYNEFGQVGDGTTDDSPGPVVVSGGHTWAQ